MAREVHERENLLRDAKAFVRRVEYRAPDGQEVFIGFRKTSAVSIYLHQDPVYHFNSAGQLRRAFAADRLYKATGGRLIAMRRERPGGEVQLVSHSLNEAETTEFIQQMHRRLAQLLTQFNEDQLQLVGQVPQDGNVGADVQKWLGEVLARPFAVAESPHAV